MKPPILDPAAPITWGALGVYLMAFMGAVIVLATQLAKSIYKRDINKNAEGIDEVMGGLAEAKKEIQTSELNTNNKMLANMQANQKALDEIREELDALKERHHALDKQCSEIRTNMHWLMRNSGGQ